MADLDMSELRRLAREVFKLGSGKVKVGVLANKGGGANHGGISMAELAAIHEYGSPAAGVPERSFIRRTFAAKEDDVAKMAARLAAGVFSGQMSATRALEILGAFGATEVKKTITEGAGVPPPNAPSTIAKKGSSRPLVDTGRLLGSIQWEVE